MPATPQLYMFTCYSTYYHLNKYLLFHAVAPWVIAVIIIAVAVTIISVLVIGLVVSCSVYYKQKTKTEPNDFHQLGPAVYEDVDDMKPDPHTEGNMAYEQIQP